MADESNGESTFEFVEKRADEISISDDTTKTDSLSSLSSTVSLLAPLGSSSTGNLLSNIAPPSALPSFLASPSDSQKDLTKADNKVDPVIGESSTHEVQTKQPRPPVQWPYDADGKPNKLYRKPGNKVDEIIGESSTHEVQTKQPRPPVQWPYDDDGNPSKIIDSVSLPDNESQDSGIPGGALFSWMKDTVVNSTMLNKVAEKAKRSVNAMITTLDPQMREFIYSGGDIELVVASNKEVKISPIREAFQEIFGEATVEGLPQLDITPTVRQPVGFAAGIATAEYRIKYARNVLIVPPNIPVVAVQSFLLEVGKDKWYDLAVLLLDDPKNGVSLQMLTQMTPVPSQVVITAQESTTEDYPQKQLGYEVSIGSLMATNLQVSFNEWHHALTGVSRRDTILLAAQSLAGIYKNTITAV